MPEEFQRDLGDVAVYELLGPEAAGGGPVFIGAAPPPADSSPVKAPT
jgi:hypothetical protein